MAKSNFRFWIGERDSHHPLRLIRVAKTDAPSWPIRKKARTVRTTGPSFLPLIPWVCSVADPRLSSVA